MQIFILIWLGQVLSSIGSGIANFALGIWVYQRTGSVTQFALISLFISLPQILISPIAGTLVDRWNRRWAMIISDSGAGLSTLAIAVLLASDRLEIWHIYLATAISSSFSAFQALAYSAAIPQLVPKAQLGRASGMTQLGIGLARLLSPVGGGILLAAIQLQGVILLDLTTFLFALATLALVRIPDVIPNVKSDTTEKAELGVLLQEAALGWSYITARPGLLGLLIFFAANNFFLEVVTVLIPPMLLTFGSAAMAGTITPISGTGLLVGSIAMSISGGPRRRIYAILGFQFLGGLAIAIGGLRRSIPLFAVCAFLFLCGWPIVLGCSQVIWQRKVPISIQGRVFAIRKMFGSSCIPLAYLLAGPLADRVFEPLMAPDGLLAGSVGKIIGVGAGRGMALLFTVMGILIMLVTIAAYQYPRLRYLEKEIPDALTNM